MPKRDASDGEVSGADRDELRRAHQQLAVKTFELRSLLDINRDLTAGSAEAVVQRLVVTTAMGHFVVARCGLYLVGPRGLELVEGRGLKRDAEREAPIALDDASAALDGALDAGSVVELPQGTLRRRLEQARFVLAAPLRAGERVLGLLAIGERASGRPFSEADREIAHTLARQAVAAFENARLQQIRELKLRQDRELQVAREIQTSLLPQSPPVVPGFELAGESRPCYEVGGDSYDWIPLEGGRLALVVADVAGKGTPASLLMATTHAFVHALAGTAPPDRVIERLNRFLFARTQASRFVTLFYAELDPVAGRLAYVNAGHVPPFLLARDEAPRRLGQGGPALGLIAEAAYDVGNVALGAGDLVAVVTDGVTEAMSPDEHELGDDRVFEALRRLFGGSAATVLGGLVAVVEDWAGARGGSDDLTALILKAR
jgi:sigma-B regulation protein RsbU (phosphoserine phosphatase)